MISNIDTYNQLTVPGIFSQLDVIREFVSSNALNFGFDAKTANSLALAVDETCTNLIRHAFKNNHDKDINISIEFSGNDFIITIRDRAESFNINTAPEVNLKEYLKKMKSGGLGIQIIKMVIDDIKYIPKKSANSNNTLILKKHLV
jgi:serine/threonine-protein kinase RsbW